MKLTQIDNATCIYEVNGFKLLCDPWLTDGAFYGSWGHYPPLVTTFDFVKDVDALFISQLNQDRCDEVTLKQFRPDIPVIILDREPNFLKRKLTALGFTNLTLVRDKETITIGPMEITIYASFVEHPFDNTDSGNLLDSAIVVEAHGKTILNANANTPDISAAEMLYDHHGAFSVVQLKDSLASSYPSCFANLSDEEKLSENKRLIGRQLTAMCDVAESLKAEWFQPFAGDYQLMGSLINKNKHLGLAGKQYSAWFISNRGIKPLILNEQGSIDLITGDLKATYRKNIESYASWRDRVSSSKFDYENDPLVKFVDLTDLIRAAVGNVKKYQEKFNFYPKQSIVLRDKETGESYAFNLGGTYGHERPVLEINMDNRLLKRILTKQSDFYTADMGCHIDFNREGPYNPYVHMIMSFFHV